MSVSVFPLDDTLGCYRKQALQRLCVCSISNVNKNLTNVQYKNGSLLDYIVDNARTEI